MRQWALKQEAPRQRHSRTGIPAIHGGEHVKTPRSLKDDTDSENTDTRELNTDDDQ
ncbi:hypothetical protein MSZK_52910 [Mycobacterium sp. shizuoka-1]|nr:hypothetical protein MSZK_52910 [Mycobacterium sp. shizuoka-1]